MTYFAQILLFVVAKLIEIELILLLVSAVMSWVMPDETNGFYRIVHALTDPVIAPIRNVLWRFRFVAQCPIDLSFLVTVLLLNVVLALIGY